MKYYVTMGRIEEAYTNRYLPLDDYTMRHLDKRFLFDSLTEARKKFRGNAYINEVYEISGNNSRYIGSIGWDLVKGERDYVKRYTWTIPKGDRSDRNGHMIVKNKWILNKDGTLGKKV